MDQKVPAPLRDLKGLWRVDGVSQASWDGRDIKVGIVLSELKPEVENPFAADASMHNAPTLITLNPHWLNSLTIGSIWNEGRLISRPDPLPGHFQVDTSKAQVLSFSRSVKLGEKYTDNGVADPDFLNPRTHRDLIASLYLLVPIEGNKQYQWMVIPCSEILRFYMGPTSRLIARVIQGRLDSLVVAGELEGDTVTLFAATDLHRLEKIIFGRAYANKDTYLAEMNEVHGRLQRINASNHNEKKNAALSIEAKFPFKGITNLTVAGVPMSLAKGFNNALFVMEILQCTYPGGYSHLIVNRANDVGVGGDKKVPGTSPLFVPQEDDEIDDVVLDTPSDARLPTKVVTRHANPFPWMDSITMENRRNQTQRDWRSEYPKIPVDVEGHAIGDGSHAGEHKGKQQINDATDSIPPSRELNSFINLLSTLELELSVKKWELQTITPNKRISTGNPNYFATSFPSIKGKRWTWHLGRQLICVEVRLGPSSDDYFYILELEQNKDAHCTALLRTEDFKKLDKDAINEFLKVTTYKNGWPNFDDKNKKDKKNDKATLAASELYKKHKLALCKVKHPKYGNNWENLLLSGINTWVSGLV
ncbi:hypothetical protein YA0002_25845 [Pseudomonas cichorii]|uniref:hypothetical protein n=1 Tax=Pseudomonas cichorii TaxID=36746 RepID=UPI0018E5F747|nr:hypothetical protein [Pseudomonas cichorii]MBI6856186.1 hypothetical protein [Pseudomonas cichorii]